MRPDPSEYSSGTAGYVANVPENEDAVLGAMEKQRDETRKLLESVSEERAAYRYAPEKWSIRQIVGHIADCERVFAYRALAIARGEKQSLPGFDENVYMQNSNFDEKPLHDLIESYVIVRNASLNLFRQMSDAQWRRTGMANGKPTSTRALAYIALGHERHHVKILRERYGI